MPCPADVKRCRGMVSVRYPLDTGNELDSGNDHPGEPVVVCHEQIGPGRGSASQLDGVGWADSLTATDVSIPFGGIPDRQIAGQQLIPACHHLSTEFDHTGPTTGRSSRTNK